MSQADHDALVEAVTRVLADSTNSFVDDDARAVLAIIAEKLETVTPEMRAAVSPRWSFEAVWSAMLRASPLGG
jgi:hypothetical protein